ncbi:M48 family metallopeptidase [Actinomadura kijaniata]|uniref:Zn-dependent protease with chaperone function n=1 Tax=Actinomadura namibiensis TaxID=182080 RepID=A0A7W3LPY3_ACTNM|nr:M48 family metallopeptidase [Actinomadura namibiensis]MBA8952087.1 Zn-dependent protease with chaperone function [Actinomadura namibiensis]
MAGTTTRGGRRAEPHGGDHEHRETGEGPLRHPRETPLFCLASLVTVGLLATALAVVGYAFDDEESLFLDVALLFAPIPLLVFVRGGMAHARQRLQSVQITATQFPEAHAVVVEAARRFGLRRVPDAYVMLGEGRLSSSAGHHQGRHYIVITSGLFEAGGRTRNPEALRFVIGREVGRLASRHTSYWRAVAGMAVSHVPVLGPAWSRAEEYTADNHGHALCPEGGPAAMRLLGAGQLLLGKVDFDALCERASTERGLFPWLVNLRSRRPPLTWRSAALRDRDRPGRLLFRPRTAPPRRRFP